MDARFADIKYVDNQQLSASDFGSRDANTDEWLPIAYTFSNSSGDNSWELKFDDLSGNTKTTVGKDTMAMAVTLRRIIFMQEKRLMTSTVYIQNADSGSSAYYSWRRLPAALFMMILSTMLVLVLIQKNGLLAVG